MWTIALQRRRLRSKEPEDEKFVFRKLADFDFLIVGLTRLRRAAILAAKVPIIENDIQTAIKKFDQALPVLKRLRDVAEHFDDYAIGKGRDRAVERRSLEVSSFSDHEFDWLGYELNFDAALEAASLLFEAIKDCKAKVLG